MQEDELVTDLKSQVAELQGKLKTAEGMVTDAYQKGLDAAIQFDQDMDGFLVKFLRKPYSSVIVFAIALGLVVAGGIVGWYSRGIF